MRPLDLLRLHHERIEAWVLEQAGIVFDAKAAPGALHMVMGCLDIRNYNNQHAN